MPFCDDRKLKIKSVYAESRAAVKFYEKRRRRLGKRTVRQDNVLRLFFLIKIAFFKKERSKFRNPSLLRGLRCYHIKIHAYFLFFAYPGALIKRAGGLAFILKKPRILFGQDKKAK